MHLLDVSSDLEQVCNDFMHTVTLKLDSGDVRLSQVVVSASQIRELEPAGAQVIRQGTMFVWSKKRSGAPAVGTIIIDREGTYWTIWKLWNQWHVETYKCFGLNLNIVTAPANTATVLKAVYSHGDAGEAKAEWRGLWSRKVGGRPRDVIPARFQPSKETALLRFGADFSEEVYRVYFEKPWPKEAAGGEFRLVDSAGQRFRVIEYYNEERIDRLATAIAVKITEGSEYWSNPGVGP